MLQFVGVEGLLTAISDFFPALTKKPRREIFIFIMCVAQFLVGLSMVTNVSTRTCQEFLRKETDAYMHKPLTAALSTVNDIISSLRVQFFVHTLMLFKASACSF